MATRTTLLHLLILAALLAGCAPTSASSAGLPTAALTAVPTAPPAAATAPALTPTALEPTAALSAAVEQAAVDAPRNASAADWREWPVIPLVTATAVRTYARGLALGNDPRAFSKIGDCQSIKEVLMGVYDLPGRYSLSEHPELQDTIDQFRGSFDRDGQAVQGGFNAASVLSPMWANPDACLPGENPLECEFREHKPSIVIISLEVWWNGRTPERYEQYMRRIIEYALEKGVVPVLSTKADNVEGDHAINLATAKLAGEYDLPLWNWWRAAQDLPNHGLDPTRPDGFHISKEAWTLRASTALQALDAVWRGVTAAPAAAALDAAPAPLASPTPATGALAAPRDLPELAKVNAPGRLVFTLEHRTGEDLTPAGAFALDFSTARLEPVDPAAVPAADSARQLTLADGSVVQPIFAPDGKAYVYRRVTSPDASTLVYSPGDGSERDVTLPGTNVLDATWSPDGKRIAVLTVNRSDYSGKWGRLNILLFTPANFDVQVMPSPQGAPGATASLNARVWWSPDGQWLATTGTDPVDAGFRISLQLIHISSRAATHLSESLGLEQPQPVFITQAAWLPEP